MHFGGLPALLYKKPVGLASWHRSLQHACTTITAMAALFWVVPADHIGCSELAGRL